jgi:hypothetical protein
MPVRRRRAAVEPVARTGGRHPPHRPRHGQDSEKAVTVMVWL